MIAATLTFLNNSRSPHTVSTKLVFEIWMVLRGILLLHEVQHTSPVLTIKMAVASSKFYENVKLCGTHLHLVLCLLCTHGKGYKKPPFFFRTTTSVVHLITWLFIPCLLLRTANTQHYKYNLYSLNFNVWLMFKLKINSLKKQQHPIQCRFQFQFVLVFIIPMKDFCSDWSLDLIVSNVTTIAQP